LERLIISMKTAVLGTDRKPYRILYETTAHTLWLSDEALNANRECNRLLSTFEGGAMTQVEFGKMNYANVASMREMIARILANDMLKLHAVHRFLKNKKTRPDPGLKPWP
jgi:hypothetical protein